MADTINTFTTYWYWPIIKKLDIGIGRYIGSYWPLTMMLSPHHMRSMLERSHTREFATRSLPDSQAAPTYSSTHRSPSTSLNTAFPLHPPQRHNLLHLKDRLVIEVAVLGRLKAILRRPRWRLLRRCSPSFSVHPWPQQALLDAFVGDPLFPLIWRQGGTK